MGENHAFRRARGNRVLRKHAYLHSLLMLFMCLLLPLLLAACGILPNPEAGVGENTPVPTATLDPAGFRAVPSKACLIADWATMQTNRPQGDLIAWRPETLDLAYINQIERSSWFVGDLVLAKAPDYSEHISLAPEYLVSGDLTWSPSGEKLAFLAFRPNENLTTVMVVNADGSGLKDLFPTDMARTDTRTSQKAIVGWTSETTIEVLSSCGDVCRNGYEIDISDSSAPSLQPTPIGDYTELGQALQMNRRMLEYGPDDFPRVMRDPATSRPHWSPNDVWVAYLDRRLLLWVLSPEDKITFPVELGLRDVSETQWSGEDSRLAVRAEDRIFIFTVPCDP